VQKETGFLLVLKSIQALRTEKAVRSFSVSSVRVGLYGCPLPGDQVTLAGYIGVYQISSLQHVA
jgi:hypothetical protein